MTQLASVSGFAALQTLMTGSLQIGDPLLGTGNAALTTLQDFGALKTIGVSLNIVNNPQLTSVSGFGALTEVGEELFIADNMRLATVSGFGALETATNLIIGAGFNFDGSLGIGHPLLTTVPDFVALTSNILEFQKNDKLIPLLCF